MNRLLAGLVDSGVAPAQAGRVAAGIDLARRGAAPGPDGIDVLGHGSAAAALLLSASPAVALLNARVFGPRLTCTAATVSAALDWLLPLGPRVVNLSFGLRRDDEALRASCARAVAAGILLVASAPARGEPVYPAAYPGVVAATGDARCAAGELSHLAGPLAEFGGHARALPPSPLAGASVGCARVSTALLEFLAAEPGADAREAIAWLRRRARYRGPERRLS